MADDRVSVTRRIGASPTAIFDIVTDPAKHVEIDGSHMLVAAAQDTKRLSAVGDSFVINMDRDALGDLPLGKYTVRNVVTRISPDSLVEWSVGSVDSAPLGHVYGYELAPAGEGETDVTHYCDWSAFDWGAVPEAMRSQLRFPVVPKMALITTLEKLDQVATQSAR
jgi:hypothetical protein